MDWFTGSSSLADSKSKMAPSGMTGRHIRILRVLRLFKSWVQVYHELEGFKLLLFFAPNSFSLNSKQSTRVEQPERDAIFNFNNSTISSSILTRTRQSAPARVLYTLMKSIGAKKKKKKLDKTALAIEKSAPFAASKHRPNNK